MTNPQLLTRSLGAIGLIALVPLLAACGIAEARDVTEAAATSEREETRQCFFARQVTGFRSVEDKDGKRLDDRVLIDVGAAETYEFALQDRCSGLRHARSIQLVRQGPGRICDGLDVDLVVQDDISPLRCPVTMVRRLPADDPWARPGAAE